MHSNQFNSLFNYSTCSSTCSPIHYSIGPSIDRLIGSSIGSSIVNLLFNLSIQTDFDLQSNNQTLRHNWPQPFDHLNSPSNCHLSVISLPPLCHLTTSIASIAIRTRCSYRWSYMTVWTRWSACVPGSAFEGSNWWMPIQHHRLLPPLLLKAIKLKAMLFALDNLSKQNGGFWCYTRDVPQSLSVPNELSRDSLSTRG